MKNSKGITLIALIITIIVMIILVAVTVNLALNGGLFGKAETATTSTSYEAEREELLMYVFGEAYDNNNNKVNLAKLKINLEEDTNKWENVTLNNETNPTKLEVTGKQSKKTHVIDTKGNITEKPANKGGYEFVGKIYRQEINKGELDIEVISDGNLLLYRGNATEEDGKITTFTNPSLIAEISFTIVTKDDDDFGTWLDEENASAQDKGGTVYNKDELDNYCLKILDEIDKETGEAIYFYGFFTNNYQNFNCDSELVLASDAETQIFKEAIK